LGVNQAGGYGGAIWTSQFPLTLSSSFFVGNTAVSLGNFTEYSARGGAIYISLTGSVKITETVFERNVVKSGQGAALFATSSSFTLDRVVFLSNRVFSSSEVNGEGGAIAMTSYYNSTITSCIFQENTALASTSLMSDGLGGALFLQSPIDSSNSVTLTESTFDLNRADRGGAIYLGSQNFIDLQSLVFSLNHALQGGAIYSDIDNLPLSRNLQFLSNTATDGGGIYIAHSHSKLLLASLIFQGNQVLQNGGALFFLDFSYELHFPR
jgi:predicted outer membrane repeat protein